MKKRILLFFLLVLCCITITAQTVRKHVVEPGETKESIARKYGVRIDELETANPVAMRNFYVCTELVIPKHVPNAEEIRQEQEFQARLAEEQRAKEQRKAERRSRLANFFGALGQAMIMTSSYNNANRGNVYNNSTGGFGYSPYSPPQFYFHKEQPVTSRETFIANYMKNNPGCTKEEAEQEYYKMHPIVTIPYTTNNIVLDPTTTPDPTPQPAPKPTRNPCKSCEIPGFGNNPGNGNCKACKGMGHVDSGFSLDQMPCATCHGNKKCVYCQGTGWQ